MEQIINGTLLIAAITYMIIILFYVENIGFFRGDGVDWKLEVKLVGVLIGLTLLINLFDLPTYFTALILLLALIGWVIKRRGYLIHDLISILMTCFAVLSVFGVPNLILQTLSLSEMTANLSNHPIFQGVSKGDQKLLINSIIYILITLIILAMHVIFKEKVNKQIFESINLKMMLLTCGIAMLLLQVRLSDDLILSDIALNLELEVALNLELIESLLFLLLLCFLGILTYINIIHTDRQFKIEKERAEIAAFEKYTAELETSYDALRVIKHDYTNMMATLKIFIDEKNLNALQEYYYEEFSELSKSLNVDSRIVDQLQRVKIKELKIILLYKLNMATEIGLNVHIEVKFVVANLPMSNMKVCQIVGILLDNAIEASQESSEKILKLAIIRGERKTTVIIENSWVTAAIPMNKFYEKGFSTKGESRGLGLATVDELVVKYEQLELTTEVEADRFIQILTIKEIAQC